VATGVGIFEYGVVPRVYFNADQVTKQQGTGTIFDIFQEQLTHHCSPETTQAF
jgi:hypothetical protein